MSAAVDERLFFKGQSKEVDSNFQGALLSEIYWKDYLDKKNYNHDINQMCSLCQEKQIKEHGKIVIECKGLATATSFIDKEYLHQFADEEQQMLEYIYNPHKWALNAFTKQMWREDRWYQEMMVRCTARYKTYRCGRRSGKSYSLALNIAHKVLTNDNFKVLIVTPFEVQAEELINYIKDFLHNLSPEWGTYKELVTKDVKSPSYFMKFSNGSRIRAFTTGSNGAASVRGQPGNLIILDEVDYMSEKDFGSITAILADNPDTELWVASTPNGKALLHKLENMKEYKSFHFPSFVLPHYTDKLDNFFREQNTVVEYIQEYMAEFGISDKGAFQTYFIDQATCDFINRDIIKKDRSRFITILGADWNDDKVGTRFVVLAFDKITKMLFVQERMTVSKEGWTQVEAVKQLIALNRKYDLDHVYVDEGFGVSTIQFIKQYAHDQYGKLPANHPDLRLAEINGVNFSSSVQVEDVATGEMLKKDMKVYMVDCTARLLERGYLLLEKKYDQELISQLNNYVKLRTSQNGKPIYGADNATIGDHDLDALMVAVLGFNMQYSQFLNGNNSSLQINVVSRDFIAGNPDSIENRIKKEIDGNPDTNGLFAYTASRTNAHKLFESRRLKGLANNRASFSSKQVTNRGFELPVGVIPVGSSSRSGSRGRASFHGSRYH